MGRESPQTREEAEKAQNLPAGEAGPFQHETPEWIPGSPAQEPRTVPLGD
jgi:hypothetical protein